MPLSQRLFAVCLLSFVLPAQGAEPAFKSVGDYGADLKGYLLAPFHWDRDDWKWAGGAVAVTAVAYTLDDQLRAAPFAPGSSKATQNTNIRDALPLFAMTVGTFAIGTLRQDSAISATGTDMAEAALLTAVSTTAIKTLSGRLRPGEALAHNQWRKGGSSFPSGHTAAVFAAAEVLSDRLPGDRQVIRWSAYGLAGLTAFARINGNHHWLSDTVAGAALGMATGRFVSERRLDSFHNVQLGIAPIPHGASLMVSASIH